MTPPDHPAERLQQEVIRPLKRRFVGRDEVIDLIALAIASGEHLFLHGPPGTAKSALIRAFAGSVRARYFEAMLTKFSEPNELFGPVDLVKLREGRVVTVIDGMLPDAEIAFLDELFNANSAILNNLLTILNERIYRRGLESHRVPLLSLFTASNAVAEDEALRALFDRFLIRCHVEPLPREQLTDLFAAGWALEEQVAPASSLTADDLRDLSRMVRSVDLGGVMARHAEMVTRVRDLGVALSDRRAVKLLKLIAASAVLCGRDRAVEADLWPIRYCWDRPEQIGALGSLVDGMLRNAGSAPDERHPLAQAGAEADGEAIARELDEAEAASKQGVPTLTGTLRLRERVAELQSRAAWVVDPAARDHLVRRAGDLLERWR